VDSQTEPVLRAELDQHAREEDSHIALWEGFSRALGTVAADDPNPETMACASEWAGEPGEELLDSLVTLYTIESGQPEISATKHAGLLRHYGLSSTEATAYFRLHEHLDVEHSSSARTLIEERLGDGGQQQRLLTRAERVLRANWLLLDGVERVAHAA
jgi:pyrroloquinoline quinone (PQQ) biosynthesis protein C